MNKKASISDLFISRQIEEVNKLVEVGLAKQKDLADAIAEIKRMLTLESSRVSPELEKAIKQVSLTARQIDQKVKD